MKDINDIKQLLRDFANERDWDQFHSPKNLSMALMAEAGELLEHFQWLSEEQSRQLDPDTREQVAQEIADVQIYLVRLADKLDIDILDAVSHKLTINSQKYPAQQVRGSADKYTAYQKQKKTSEE
ncbi:MAG: nucleotide pyrophosphohydrolase [Gammaproteobacteria bacterium]|nr:nucleotide pyrophosphohydrolase [Gammaproteobacteria bacterium]|tara:strand:- start:212032 stop:212406 length:375 start_codon:yes stop_codon:yes gene_type:complete